MSESIEADEVSRVSLKLPRHPRPITAKNLVSSPDHLPPSLLSPPSEDDISTTAHCIAILPTLPRVLQRGISEDHAAEEEGEERGKDDTAVILFPPEGDGQLVRALVMGEGTGSCPSGQCASSGSVRPHHADPRTDILYLSTTILSFISSTPSPEDLLRPYLNRLSTETLFEAFYLSHRPRLPSTSRSAGVTLLEPYHDDELLTEGLDWEAQQGEKAFWAVMGGRGEVEVEEGKGFFDRKVEEGEDPEDDGDL
jgi:hypothetical protein